MSETDLYQGENIKALREDEAARAARRVITSKDAIRSPLPENCIVLPMRILDKPEPIKRE
jgi:hypothetical protein